jgi:hypothetical protein
MTTSLVDLSGRRFGKLTVAWPVAKVHRRKTFWLAFCDCGNFRTVRADQVVDGHPRHCGCVPSKSVKHGHKRNGRCSPEYLTWQAIVARTTRRTHAQWENYGGRGIRMCRRWRYSFVNFLSDMGARPSAKHSIDRWPDNNGDYRPSNCRWATPTQQHNNTRRNVFLTFNGERHTVSEWAKILGMRAVTLRTRLYDGWTIKRALTEPVRKRA